MNLRKATAAFVVAVTLLLTLCSCGEKVGTGACEYKDTRDITGREITYVEMCVEDYGKIIILVDATTAPITVKNFLNLVNEGFYNGLTFHRVVKDFMIQGGDPDGNGSGGSLTQIEGEFSSNGHENDIKHLRGVISMARTSDPNSASSQFFICNDDASSLDGDYAAFGYVVKGMSVVDKITDKVFPKTKMAEYYGTAYHQYWAYYGNGAVENDSDKPVIKYIKVLSDYTG